MWSQTAMPGKLMVSTHSTPEVRYRICEQWPEARYFIALPDALNETTPVLVAVHGISQDARRHAIIFGRSCSRLGLAVVAPLFAHSSFPKYQRLGVSGKQRGPRPDHALNAILAEVTMRTGVPTDRVYMCGYSGGAQFVHRYAMTSPDRVYAAALGAAGWYTFPDPGKSYPYGLGVDPGMADFQFDPEKFLRVPMIVMVGGQDDKRDSSLNTSRRIDRQQGLSRSQRGQRWVDAMREAARCHGYDTRYEYRELEGCGHSFEQCVTTGEMDQQALEFLIDGADTATARNTALTQNK
jgi:poly(3-hydroxybutyrate) depolymerase